MPSGVYVRSETYKKKIAESMKGEKNYFFGRHHSPETRKKMKEAKRGEKHNNWRGGILRWESRIYLYRPDHPKATSDNPHIARSHLVWEAHHGPLPAGFVIHHQNGDPRDDQIENLQMLTRSDHTALHNLGKKRPKQLGIPQKVVINIIPRKEV
jgi:hypothetical protein